MQFMCVCVCLEEWGVVKLRPQRDDRPPLLCSGGVFVRGGKMAVVQSAVFGVKATLLEHLANS